MLDRIRTSGWPGLLNFVCTLLIQSSPKRLLKAICFSGLRSCPRKTITARSCNARTMRSNIVSSISCARSTPVISAPTGASALLTTIAGPLLCCSGPGARSGRDIAQDPLRVAAENQLLVGLRNALVLVQQLHVLELHAPARIVVRVIGGEQELRSAQEIDRVRKFVLLGFDREQNVFPEVVTRRLLVLVPVDLRGRDPSSVQHADMAVVTRR